MISACTPSSSQSATLTQPADDSAQPTGVTNSQIGIPISVVITTPPPKVQNVLGILLVKDHLQQADCSKLSVLNKQIRILTWFAGFIKQCKKPLSVVQPQVINSLSNRDVDLAKEKCSEDTSEMHQEKDHFQNEVDIKANKNCSDLLDKLYVLLAELDLPPDELSAKAEHMQLLAELHLSRLSDEQIYRFEGFVYPDLRTGLLKDVGKVIEILADSGICPTSSTEIAVEVQGLAEMGLRFVADRFADLVEANAKFEARKYVSFFDQRMPTQMARRINHFFPVMGALQASDLQLALDLTKIEGDLHCQDFIIRSVLNLCFHQPRNEDASTEEDHDNDNFENTYQFKFSEQHYCLYRYDTIFEGMDIGQLITFASHIHDKNSRTQALFWCVGYLLHKNLFTDLLTLLQRESRLVGSNCPTMQSAFERYVIPVIHLTSPMETGDWRIWYKILEFIPYFQDADTQDLCYINCCRSLPKQALLEGTGGYALLWEKILSCLNKISTLRRKRQGLLEVYSEQFNRPLLTAKLRAYFLKGRLPLTCDKILLDLSLMVIRHTVVQEPSHKSLFSEFSILCRELEFCKSLQRPTKKQKVSQ